MEKKNDNTTTIELGANLGKTSAFREWLLGDSGPNDGYFMTNSDFHGYWMTPSNDGDKGYLNFVLNRLEGILSGLPISDGLMMHYQRNCDTFVQVDAQAANPPRDITLIGLDGLHFKHMLTVESAAYCILHDIPLLDAGKDTTLFTKREGYFKEIMEISNWFPDLKEKLPALRKSIEKNVPEPGSIHITYTGQLYPLRISTDGPGMEGFKSYLSEEMRKVKPGEPLPDKMFVHYDLPDISGLHYSDGEDKNEFLTHKLYNRLINQEGTIPMVIVHLHEAMYSVQNDIPLLSCDARRQFERPDYFDKCNEMRRSAPDLSAKLDALQGREEEEPNKARHVPARSVKPKKQGPKV